MSIYNKTNHFLATITERYSLCASNSDKTTIHIVLDIKGSDLTYQVGDSIAVQAVNGQELVNKTLKALSATGDEIVKDKKQEQSYSLREFLTKKGNLTEVNRQLIGEIAQRQTNSTKKQTLEALLEEGQRDQLKAYQASHEVWDALTENYESTFSPQELCLLLMPLLPRFYSIASAMSAVGEEIHLTVARVAYKAGGHLRQGICTNYLCDFAPMNEAVIPIYIQPANGFTLPVNDSIPIIMVGPGTGVAPFRAFMQEREATGATGHNWLFFGEQQREKHFYYENYWKQLQDAGKMNLTTAFSRDQEHKIYVQHRLLDHGREIFDLLEQGAHFYVCGDAQQMAKDVDAAIHQIIQVHGNHDEQLAKDYVKGLKKSKRYLRDVY